MGKTKVKTEELINAIRKKRTISYLSNKFKVTESDILSHLTILQISSYPRYPNLMIWEEEGVLWAHYNPKPIGREEVVGSHLWDGEDIIFGVVSDTHMGSKYEAIDELRRFYDILEERGVTTVYHVGDISEGYYTNRPTSIMDCHAVGFSAQVRHIVKNYPYKDSIKTYYLTGNHDITHMRNGFADIGAEIEAQRKDMIYLGHNFHKLSLTPYITLSLIHPTDGASQSLSLKLQHMVDRNESRRADIMLVGHYHKSCGIKYRGCYAYMVPSFQKQTPFMSDNNLVSDVAGMIFTLKVDKDGRLLSVTTEYIDMTA